MSRGLRIWDRRKISSLLRYDTGKTFFTLPWLWLSVAMLSCIKIWLVRGQTLCAIDGPHDDMLFLNIADNLAHGKWLGDYNNLTLAKGMFYPLFVAAGYRIGVPLLLAQQMLYIFACLLLVVAIRPIVRAPLMLLFIFTILLFNPMSSDVGLATRVAREGIYPALALMLVGLTAGLLVRLHRPYHTILWWSAGLGLAVSAFWLTREEGVWILPFILIVAGFSTVRTWRTKPVNRLRLLYWALPLCIWLLSSGIVAGLNKVHYGIFTTVEFKEPGFVSAYGALSRVKHTNWLPYVLVPRETRDRIYKASSAFSELRPFLEGNIGRQWSNAFKDLNKKVIYKQMEKDPLFAERVKEYLRENEGDLIIKLWTSNKANTVFDGTEIPGGWFMWALRDAVAAAGHYSSGAAAADYYRRLAHEINIACDEGRLECYGKRATMMAPWHSEYNSYLKNSLIKGMRFLADFEMLYLQGRPSVGSEKSLTAFKKLTRERLSPVEVEIKGWAFSPDNTVDFSVQRESGAPVFAKVTPSQPSEDVYRFFLAKGLDFPNARAARFEITTPYMPDRYLHIRASNRLIRRLPLKENANALDVYTPELRMHIEPLRIIDATPSQARRDALRVGILEFIGKGYRLFAPLLNIAGLAAFLIGTIIMIIRRKIVSTQWMICAGLLTSNLTLVAIVSLIHITAFPAIPNYLGPSYPIQLLFSAMAFMVPFKWDRLALKSP